MTSEARQAVVTPPNPPDPPHMIFPRRLPRKDVKRRAVDEQVSRLLETRQGQSEFWRQLQLEADKTTVIDLLKNSLNLPGDVIECGVFRGRSFLKLARILRDLAPEKTLYGCDSFEGFPPGSVQPVDIKWWQLLPRVSKKFQNADDVPARLNRIIATYNLNARLVRGYFEQTLATVPSTAFCFVHLDCDLYASYLDCLEALYPRLVPGGCIVFDDYGGPKWPGADRAVDEFCKAQNLRLQRIEGWPTEVFYIIKPG